MLWPVIMSYSYDVNISNYYIRRRKICQRALNWVIKNFCTHSCISCEKTSCNYVVSMTVFTAKICYTLLIFTVAYPKLHHFILTHTITLRESKVCLLTLTIGSHTSNCMQPLSSMYAEDIEWCLWRVIGVAQGGSRKIDIGGSCSN